VWLEDSLRSDLDRLASALDLCRGGRFCRSFQLVRGAKPPRRPRVDPMMVTQRIAPLQRERR
jgi:hypothetical protein